MPATKLAVSVLLVVLFGAALVLLHRAVHPSLRAVRALPWYDRALFAVIAGTTSLAAILGPIVWLGPFGAILAPVTITLAIEFSFFYVERSRRERSVHRERLERALSEKEQPRGPVGGLVWRIAKRLAGKD
jgi:hypothetical protein